VSLALYRRYRPETFTEVIGQEHVTEPLRQALRNDRVHHAYLFSGPRGCGKTTSARILARALNCEQGPTPDPCGVCQSCRDLARGGPGSIDVIEIDAASHGGVDDARDLRERAFFAPAAARYKIYIIDEAHMVTSAGFNALLKVVEEPPEHLKFIFATTEPEKVIGTIRSRTHHYPFRLIPPSVLRVYLTTLCEREGVPVEPAVFPLVVRAGAGSARDSLSVLDQLIAGAGAEGVTYSMATALLGYTDGTLLDDVVEAFAAHDGAAVFEIVDRVIEGGHDPRRFVTDLLERFRDLVILAAVPDAATKGLIDRPEDQLDRMRTQAASLGPAELSRAADLVNVGLTEMRGTTAPRLQLELICARVLLPSAADDERGVAARLDRLERRMAIGGAPVGDSPPPAAQSHVPPAAQAAAAPAAEVPSQAARASAASPPEPGPATTPPEPVAGSHGPVPAESATAPVPAEDGAQAPPPEPAGEPSPPARPSTRRPERSPAAQASGPDQPPPASPGAPSGGLDTVAVRRTWPELLDAVKKRRRFSWILLSQNAQVAALDGTALSIAFVNAGARDSFLSSGSDEILRQAVIDVLGVDWQVECIVDPSGGSTAGHGPALAPAQPHQPPPGVPGPRPGRPAAGSDGPVGPGPQGEQRGRAVPPGSAPGSDPGGPGAPGSRAPGSAQRGAGPQGGAMQSSATGPGTTATMATAISDPAPPAAVRQRAPGLRVVSPAPVVAPEDDVARDDDPDVEDSGLSGHELVQRELGARIIDEFENT
jgi:DNA polymerase-3 subunit gamma/tau